MTKPSLQEVLEKQKQKIELLKSDLLKPTSSNEALSLNHIIEKPDEINHDSNLNESKTHESKKHEPKEHELKTHSSKEHDSNLHEPKMHDSKSHGSQKHDTKIHSNVDGVEVHGQKVHMNVHNKEPSSHRSNEKGLQIHKSHIDDFHNQHLTNTEDKPKKTKHILLSKDNMKVLFMDLPKKHKFWVKNGSEINNLTELYKSLVDMSKDDFSHYVNAEKDDFADWIKIVLGDTVLSRRLKVSKTKLEHVELVKNRIDELKNKGHILPHPNSRLVPDFSFIKIDKKSKKDNSLTAISEELVDADFTRFKENIKNSKNDRDNIKTEINHPNKKREHKDFKIMRKTLKPDSSFIEYLKEFEQKNNGQFNEIIHTQSVVQKDIEKEILEQKKVDNDLDSLKKEYSEVKNKLSQITTDLLSVKYELQKHAHEKKQVEDETINDMKQVVKELRDYEKAMLAEIKLIKEKEDFLIKKSNDIFKHEDQLLKKESELIKKEDKYNEAILKYNNLLKNYDKELKTDEQKIEKLFKGLQLSSASDSSSNVVQLNEVQLNSGQLDAVNENSAAQIESVSQENIETMNDSSFENNKIQNSNNSELKNSQVKNSEPEKFQINNPDLSDSNPNDSFANDSVPSNSNSNNLSLINSNDSDLNNPQTSNKDNMPVDNSSNFLEKMEIENLLKSTNLYLSTKKFTAARQNIERIKEIIKNTTLNAKYKEKIYYQIFELTTDIQLDVSTTQI